MIKLKLPNSIIFDNIKYKIEFNDKSHVCLKCGLLVFCRKSSYLICKKLSLGHSQYFKRI